MDETQDQPLVFDFAMYVGAAVACAGSGACRRRGSRSECGCVTTHHRKRSTGDRPEGCRTG